MSELETFTKRLARTVAERIGGPGDISRLRRLTGGATKETWSFAARIGDEDVPLILQISKQLPEGEEDNDPGHLPKLAGAEDTAIMVAAQAAGVPVPRVRTALKPEDGLGTGHITDFVTGETIARRILREPEFAPLRGSFATQCGEILGRIHAIDRASLPFLRESSPAAQVEAYQKIYESFGYPIPTLDLAFQWVKDHLPRNPRTTVVHGDFRLGNVICGPDIIRAVIDWEIACIDDPVQDLGWVCTKTWRFGGKQPVGGLGTREELLSSYEKASGVAVDPAHLAFWEAWGSVKWGVMCLLKGQAHRRAAHERTVEAFAIGRRMPEPLYDFYNLLSGRD